MVGVFKLLLYLIIILIIILVPILIAIFIAVFMPSFDMTHIWRLMLILFLLALPIYWAYKKTLEFSRQRRKKRLSKVLVPLAFVDLEQDGKKHYPNFPTSAMLFNQSDFQKVNIIFGQSAEESETWVFDYQWRDETRKGTAIYSQTVISFKSDCFDFPLFSLQVKRWFSGLQKNDFKKQRIKSHKMFNRTYLLLSPNPISWETFLSDPLIAFLLDHKGLCLEGHGEYIFVYRERKTVPAERVIGFLEEASDLFEILRK